jgi:hydrogenase maturation protein HypF
VALSGGVFGTVVLLERSVDALGGNGFRVLTHSRVPCNNGGLSLGQAPSPQPAPARPRSR